MIKRGMPEHNSWRSMIARCYDPKNKSFHNYGGRGISVCARWFDFEWFLEDVGKKPGPEYQLDRIDNNGNYELGNVKWSTPSEQRCNQRIPTKYKSFEVYWQDYLDRND